MDEISAQQAVVLSILDRLQDDQPNLTRDAPKTHEESIFDLKQAIRQDLENLLNSRRRGLSWPAHLSELAQSLVNYGLPDLTGLDTGTAESREGLRRTLETVIRTFEPRFKAVRVRMLNNAEPTDRTLRFRIDAVVRIDPITEPVIYDSTVDPVVGNLEIRGVKS
jgi:type VI secretion system protein ImpF